MLNEAVMFNKTIISELRKVAAFMVFAFLGRQKATNSRACMVERYEVSRKHTEILGILPKRSST